MEFVSIGFRDINSLFQSKFGSFQIKSLNLVPKLDKRWKNIKSFSPSFRGCLDIDFYYIYKAENWHIKSNNPIQTRNIWVVKENICSLLTCLQVISYDKLAFCKYFLTTVIPYLSTYCTHMINNIVF